MKTADRRDPNRWVTAPCTPRPWCGWSELSLVHGGWEARKTPAAGEVFFLDFPLYRTSKDLGLIGGEKVNAARAKLNANTTLLLNLGRFQMADHVMFSKCISLSFTTTSARI
jgi:hypothetical protein